jgi:hypothetical protein
MLSFADKLLHLSLPDADSSRKGHRLTPSHGDVCFDSAKQPPIGPINDQFFPKTRKNEEKEVKSHEKIGKNFENL